MLGRLRRTSRLDVGLSLSFVGLAFMAWALVAGVSRVMMENVILLEEKLGDIPAVTSNLKIFFVDTGFIIDVVGIAWMALSLALVFLASRQRISITWAWLSAVLQSLSAAAGALLVGWGVYAPHIIEGETNKTVLAKVSQISLPVIIALAILIWVVFAIWMLIDRARLDRRGPTLTDGLRTNR